MREMQSALKQQRTAQRRELGGRRTTARPTEKNDKDGTSALKVDTTAEGEKGLCVDDRGLKSLCWVGINGAIKRVDRERQMEY